MGLPEVHSKFHNSEEHRVRVLSSKMGALRLIG